MIKTISGKFNSPAWIIYVQAFFAVWAIVLLGGLTTRNILTPVLYLALLCLFQYASSRRNSSPSIYDSRISVITPALSLIFSLFTLMAEHENMAAGLENPAFRIFILIAGGLGLLFLFYYFLLLVFISLSGVTLRKEYAPLRFLPLISFFACLLLWLPYFLYEYPAIMTPDSINQFEQVLGMVPYSNHHPWAHTMVIKFFFSLGHLFTDDINAALAFYTLFQMCFMAFCVAWLISSLQRLGTGNLPCLLILGFYALVPYHGVFVVTIWKDILFSGSMLLFTTALLRLLLLFPKNRRSRNRSGNRKADIFFSLTVYIISGLMLCLFRTNGWYAFLFSLPFLMVAFRHCWKVMLPIHFFVIAAALIIKIPVMNVFHVTQPDFVESVSIPLQQTARVICEDKGLTPEQWNSVHKVIDTTYIQDLYAPGFADNMKELVRAGNPNYLTENKGEYFRLWLSLGLRYPSVYMQAYIDQTKGYWYPDVEYAVGNIDGIIPSQTGASSHPVIGGVFVIKTKEILLKLSDMLPLYGLLTSMGAMFWAFLCCFGISIIKEQPDRYILFLPGLTVMFTLFLATPVSSEFRYAYSLAYTLPLYLLVPFFPID